jgi:hypothetical protein
MGSSGIVLVGFESVRVLYLLGNRCSDFSSTGIIAKLRLLCKRKRKKYHDLPGFYKYVYVSTWLRALQIAIGAARGGRATKPGRLSPVFSEISRFILGSRVPAFTLT